MRCSSECLWLLGLFQGSLVSVCFCLQTERRCPVTFGLDRRLNVYSFEKQDQQALVELLGYQNNTFFMVKIYIRFLSCRNTILYTGHFLNRNVFPFLSGCPESKVKVSAGLVAWEGECHLCLSPLSSFYGLLAVSCVLWLVDGTSPYLLPCFHGIPPVLGDGLQIFFFDQDTDPTR